MPDARALVATPSAPAAAVPLRDLDRRILPRLVWLVFPPAFLLSIPLARILQPELHARWFNRKEGPIEWLTFAALAIGVGAGARAWRLRRRLPDRRTRAWLAVLILGAAYFALEEVSWGQTFFGWSSPALFESFNDQGETNLHNSSSWFDQKPRVLFEGWILVAGLLVPLLREPRPAGGRTAAAWFWPTRLTVPAAAAAIVVRVPDRIEKLHGRFEQPVLADLRLSEPQELLFGWFLMLLLVSFHLRLRALPSAAAEP